MDGIWTLHEDGSFELAEPYSTMLKEAKVAATRGWTAALMSYLEPRCPYDSQELVEALTERNERPEGKMAVFEEFVLEALSGDL